LLTFQVTFVRQTFSVEKNQYKYMLVAHNCVYSSHNSVYNIGKGGEILEVEVKLLEMMARNNIRRIEDLHKMTGLSRTTIGLILDGKKKSLYFDTIGLLCETLNCRIEELIVLKK
jgi:putative transcriptional regulator